MRPRTSRILQLSVGAFGLAGLLLSASILNRVMRSPGDDNPIGMLAAFGVYLSLIPSWGLVRAARGLPLGSGKLGKLWAAAAALSLVPLGLLITMFAAIWMA
ncbi:hypothetical protein [Sorangium sp. So ce861]|uniref:hypothetical protein n=1 Tax=Sorangium sp. So ce861 TaxID=3133323 RepID=UPI003F62E367